MKKILFIISTLVLVLCMEPALMFFWRVVAVGLQHPLEVIAVCMVGLISLLYYEYKENISTAIEKLL